MYSERLLDHFQSPRHAGELPGASVTVRRENPVCGDVLELSGVVREGVVEAIRFRAKGCVPAMACGSAVCELAHGRTVADVRGISREDVLDVVGGVPEASDHAAQLAVDAVRALVGKE